MKNIIEIKGLNFKYNEKQIFKDLNLNIEEGTFTTIIGNNNSGKSTLVRILTGLEKSDSKIIIDDLILNEFNVKTIREKIGVIFENPDDNMIQDNVLDEIIFTLENMNLDKEKIKKRVDYVSTLLNIEKLLYRNVNQLSGGEKQLVLLASIIAVNTKIIILDDAFTMIDSLTKDKIYKILKKINKENKITIINITHDIEDSLFGDEIIVMNNGNIVIQENTKLFFNQEKLLKKLNIQIPFIVEVSQKLKYYNLVDNLVFDMDKLVNIIWK